MIEKEFKVGKYKCKVIRNESLGNLCGYVGLPKNHPDWGKDYDDVDINVHGGLTFGTQGRKSSNWNNPNLWWFGFDCAHLGDYVIGISHHHGDVLWTIEMVEREIENMVEQFEERKNDNKCK